jgi:hypothetical protein
LSRFESRLRRRQKSLATKSPSRRSILPGERQNTNKSRLTKNLKMPIFRRKKKNTEPLPPANVWARPEMKVTFRAEIMPGREREQRTFRIKEVLPNGRIKLYDFVGEHRQGAFEPINFLREKAARSHQK